MRMLSAPPADTKVIDGPHYRAEELAANAKTENTLILRAGKHTGIEQ